LADLFTSDSSTNIGQALSINDDSHAITLIARKLQVVTSGDSYGKQNNHSNIDTLHAVAKWSIKTLQQANNRRRTQRPPSNFSSSSSTTAWTCHKLDESKRGNFTERQFCRTSHNSLSRTSQTTETSQNFEDLDLVLGRPKFEKEYTASNTRLPLPVSLNTIIQLSLLATVERFD